QRHHADGHAQRRDEGDHGDEGLLAFREQIAKRDVELERKIEADPDPRPDRKRGDRGEPLARRTARAGRMRHAIHSRFLISGNRITSRIDGLLVSSMTSRSMPTPSPPVGGSPYSSARMYSSSIAWASRSPRARLLNCASKRRRCSAGSFSSLKALATSNPPMYSSNRSTVSRSSGFCFESGDTSVGKAKTKVGWTS